MDSLSNSDDVWYQNKIEKQLLSYNSSKKKYNLIHTNEIWKLNGRNINQKLKHMKFGGNIFEKCLPLCVISPSSVLIKKEIFKKYGLFDENLPVCEDYDLWLRITSKEEVLFINEPLVIKYGGHLDQLSKQYKIMDRFRVIALEKLLIDKRISDKQLSLTYNMLKEKIKIILNGAVKRGNLKLINFYSKKLNYWKVFRKNMKSIYWVVSLKSEAFTIIKELRLFKFKNKNKFLIYKNDCGSH